MKNLIDDYGLIIVIIVVAFLGIILFSVHQVPSLELSGGIVVIISAMFGVLLTVAITRALLTRQSQIEKEQKENAKKFEKKLETYEIFLKTLLEIVKKGGVLTEVDTKELVFQIALVRMHTKSEQVVELLEDIGRIVDKMSDFNEIPDLSIHIMTMIENLQKELYTQAEIGERVDQEKIKDVVKKLTTSLADATELDIDSIESSQDLELLTQNFEKDLQKRLQERLQTSDYIYSQEGKGTPNFHITKKEWRGVKVVLLCRNNKLHLSVQGADESSYRNMYMALRRKFGGSFNKWLWIVRLKTYANWPGTDKDIVEEKVLSYICPRLIGSVNFVDEYFKELH